MPWSPQLQHRLPRPNTQPYEGQHPGSSHPNISRFVSGGYELVGIPKRMSAEGWCVVGKADWNFRQPTKSVTFHRSDRATAEDCSNAVALYLVAKIASYIKVSFYGRIIAEWSCIYVGIIDGIVIFALKEIY